MAAASVPTAAPTTRPAPTTTQTSLTPAPTLRTDAPIVTGNAARFAGFGVWIDVYDWSSEYTGGKPYVGPSDVARMASLGAQTLYVQATKKNSANDIVDNGLLQPLIREARKQRMTVIAWYVPSFEDPALDLRRMLAMSRLDVDGIGVDIESRAVADPAERSRRLVDLSVALRQQLPGVPIAAIPMPAAQLEVVNPSYWPGFPYKELAPLYDAWMPMSYWTHRTQASGYRNAYTYTAENIDRLRAQLNNGAAAIHPIGGIGDMTTPEDIQGMYRAAAERGAIGGSIYDYRTTSDALWGPLQQYRR